MAANSTDSDPNLALLNGTPPSAAPASLDDPNLAVLNGPSASSDPNLAALNGPTTAPKLSSDDIQQKRPRWQPILAGQSMGTPADWAEMTAAGVPADTIQRAQTETSLRQQYIDQQSRGPGERMWTGAKAALGGIGQSITGLPQLAAAIASPDPAARMTGAASAVEGSSQAATSLLGMAGDLISAVTPTPPSLTPSAEDNYQNWKSKYLLANPIPGYAPPPSSSRIQDALQYLTGAPAQALPAPDPDQTAGASLLASLPLFEGATGLAGKVLPKALEATGAAEVASKYAPTLANIGDPAAAQAAKMRNAMTEAVEPGSTPLLAKDVTAPVVKAATSVANKVAERAGNLVSGAGIAATALTDKISTLPGMSSDFGKYLATQVLGPYSKVAYGAIKALETAGPKAIDLGDFASRIAAAPSDSAFGRFAALAADDTAPDWMHKLAKNPVIDLATRAGTAAAGALKGGAEGAATGAALSILSNNSPEETGANIANFGAFGAAHGGMSAEQSRVFDSHIPAVTKFITDSLTAGTAPETLRLVTASSILQASLTKNALPDVSVRFATPRDADSPFGPNAVGEGMGGLYDSDTKTVWINPALPNKGRSSSALLLHEIYHPIFQKMVAEQPGIRTTIDSALKASGSSLDEFASQYSNALRPNDPQAAAEFKAKQNPDYWYSEILSESAAHNLEGKNLLSVMQKGTPVEQTATQSALAGVSGWLNDMGVEFKKNQESGTIFPDFKGSFNDASLRSLTYKLLKTQRDSLGRPPAEAPEAPTTSADMGGKKAPYYPMPGGVQGNAYGREVTLPNGKTDFKPWPKSELRARAKADADARKKYFPEAGKSVTQMPANLESDPAIAPWTKTALKAVFDSIQNKDNLAGFYHRLNGENSATSDKGWAADARRTLGNTQVSYQSGKPIGVKLTKKGNLIVDWESEASENQKLAAWAQRHGELSLDLWNGDIAKAKADIQTYLQNHATGQPGDANGIGAAKRDVINALLTGANKEFEKSNPLRSQLKKADRQGVMRSLRVDRMESLEPTQSDRPAGDWEKQKRNLSPAQRDIELTGPDGTKYPAKYGGIQETLDPANPWLTITPMVDLPGATVAKSTTFAHSLAKKGYSVPPELLEEIKNHVAAQAQQFSPSAIAAAAVRDKETGRIFAGATHFLARIKSPKSGESLEDGFVTNSGEFLTRDKAFERAVAAKQYKPSGEDYNADKIRYGLTSERFNKQNPSTGAAVARAESVLEESQPQALRPGIEPAVKWKGKVYTNAELAELPGADVASKLRSKGVLKDSDWTDVDYDNPDKPSGYLVEHGFADKKGKWVKAKDAYKAPARPTYSPTTEAKNVRTPDKDIRDQASEYTTERGLTHEPFTGYAALNEDLGKRAADAYESAPHIPNDPKVQASYKALADETRAQWDFLTKKGVTFEPWAAKGQPYESSADMRKDVQNNKHLWFFPTAQGFGEGEESTNNPMLAPTGITVDKVPLVTNDLFRAVHDYFGHAKEGYEFGPRGEYNAYLAHSRMFSDAALPALTAETMGQNSWVNFGKHLRDEAGNIPKKGEKGYIAPQDRPFADQKATALPDDLAKESVAPAFSPAATDPVYFSKLKDTVDEKFSGESMPAAQLAAVLRNPANGIKADELKWSGLDDFLKGKNRVTKQEVQTYLNSQDMTPVETTKQELNPDLEWKTGSGSYQSELTLHKAGKPVSPKVKIKIVRNGNSYAHEIYVGNGEKPTITSYGDLPQAMRAAEKEAGLGVGREDKTQYSKFVQPGPKENYREILFQLPFNHPSFKDNHFESAHWDEQNVIAHTRVDDRVNSRNQPGLFVQEIQSDWHQEGRKKGYKSKELDDAYTAYRLAAHAAKAKFLETKDEKTFDAAIDAAAAVRDAVREKVNPEGENLENAVPDAPLKTTWQETIFRRLVQMAVQTGKEWIGWTTGKQQAERYDLSKAVESVVYHPESKLLQAFGKEAGAPKVLEEHGVEPEKISDYIGKGVAEKLLASNPTEAGWHELSGLDLKVGGEGMSGFYDKILVDYANKFGKKFGARVSHTSLDEDDEGRHFTAHMLPITPEMKESVKQGISMYSPPAAPSHPQTLSRPQMVKWLLDNKAWDSVGVLDAKAARWIARHGKSWTLTTIPTDELDHSLVDKSHAAPGQPIVARLDKDGMWEVLDGQHRVSDALAAGTVASLPAYIPSEDKSQASPPAAPGAGSKASSIEPGTAPQSRKLPRFAAPLAPQNQQR